MHPTQAHVTQQGPPIASLSSRAVPTIHPRNRYADKTPDFAALAQSFPELQQYIRSHKDGKASIDFRNAQGCKCLTKALLHHDFNITWDIPDGQLVPPLANRANYIHWLEDLLQLSSPSPSHPVKGKTHRHMLLYQLLSPNPWLLEIHTFAMSESGTANIARHVVRMQLFSQSMSKHVIDNVRLVFVCLLSQCFDNDPASTHCYWVNNPYVCYTSAVLAHPRAA